MRCTGSRWPSTNRWTRCRDTGVTPMSRVASRAAGAGGLPVRPRRCGHRTARFAVPGGPFFLLQARETSTCAALWVSRSSPAALERVSFPVGGDVSALVWTGCAPFESDRRGRYYANPANRPSSRPWGPARPPLAAHRPPMLRRELQATVVTATMPLLSRSRLREGRTASSFAACRGTSGRALEWPDRAAE